MGLIPGNTQKTFNLLGIGYRGVGKTVFLAGSYTDLKIGPHASSRQRYSLDCLDSAVQDNIEGLLRYVSQTGKFPPPTTNSPTLAFRSNSAVCWATKTSASFAGGISPVNPVPFRILTFVL